ncbi:uncharacterized protein [Anabrus simplex]|uniref:uncharacterized protein n=1 Tax=Anabrus simplex TaxID=316456 RepID=UPI0035A3A820
MQLPAVAVLLLVVCTLPHAEGHGRLIEPPSRATMWRYGFNTPPDYNDHEQYCGGFNRQWQRNGGKCGICGDPWDSPKPRAHEAGGKYGQGVIVRRYKTGAVFTIRVELTANHRGYFEFRLCPNNNPRQTGTQECLDRYLLKRAKPTGMSSAREPSDEQPHEAKYYPGPGNKVFEIRYSLPDGLTCSQCILQWRYIAGNNWGKCTNGSEAVGCGPQEEFRACADVAIVDSTGTADETPYIDNEIPTYHAEKTTKEPVGVTEKPEASAQDWWTLIAIVICAFIAVSALLALLYLYYYHAADTVKRWLMGGRFTKKQPPPVPPPRVRKHRDEV